MLDAEFIDWLSVSVAEAVAEPYVTAQVRVRVRVS